MSLDGDGDSDEVEAGVVALDEAEVLAGAEASVLAAVSLAEVDSMVVEEAWDLVEVMGGGGRCQGDMEEDIDIDGGIEQQVCQVGCDMDMIQLMILDMTQENMTIHQRRYHQ